VKAWIIAARPFAYPWILINTLLGVSLAGFSVYAWLLAFVIVTLVLTAGHFYNAWVDYVRGFDKVEEGSKVKPYTAGSQVLPRGWLSLRTVKISTFVLLIIAVILMLFVPVRFDVYGLFALGVFCAFAYSLFLKPKGLGEVGLFLGHGFATTSFAYALVKPLDYTGVSAGVLLGFWAGVLYTVDQWQDVETDFAKRVKNLAYLMFKANFRVSTLWFFLITGAFTLQFGFILLGLLPVRTLLSLFILPLSHVTAILLDYHFEKGVLLALLSMWLFALLMAIGVLV
jgi:4-hydroxybenzoate polyprenyltransferase